MKKAAIICAQGLGDGLLMMIVAHQLKRAGYQSTVFHSYFKELTPLFNDISIHPYPPLKELAFILAPFDRVIIENDHSERAYYLFNLRNTKKLNHLIFFFPTPSPKFQKGDFLFNPHLPVATNICRGCQTVLLLKNANKQNGLLTPKGKILRKFSKRIVIHPTSNDPRRNWLSSQFLRLACLLQQEGYKMVFSVSPSERPKWLHIEQKGFTLPYFTNFSELTAYLFESGFLIGNDSGVGHLASNLNIPTLTISGNPKRVRLWRPDWNTGHVVTLSFPLPNFKGIKCRIRENIWQHFISVSRTLKAFHELKKAIE